MLKEIKRRCEIGRGRQGPAAGAGQGISGDQITKDALLFTAGPIEAPSSIAAERKEAKAAARRF
tara:strand:- start:13526 stop:13717 length:192 start_codon:yes stop_codon:yes gene_type:complete